MEESGVSSQSFQAYTSATEDRRGRSARRAERLSKNISKRLRKEAAENMLDEIYLKDTSEKERKNSMVEILSAQLQAIHDLKMMT